MRAVFVLFDSLNRHALGCYGGTEVDTPNFDRFARRGRVFDNHYVGSLPCMPARRDMHTGRLNFTHRSWGPLEVFDNSFAQILKQNGVHTHLVSDHLHYFEDGGAGYHTRFSTWDFIRGQEHDPWIAMVEPPLERYRKQFDDRHYEFRAGAMRTQHIINRETFKSEDDFPGPKCFASGLKFLDRNRDADNWFMMLECFDPHEPFHAPDRFKDAYQTGYRGKILDWPKYRKTTETEEEIREIRGNYAALLAMCDDYFGKLLDYFDAHDMWKDTALILSTDHGFLLSEHEWWGKMRMPYYEEISHIPLIFHDPTNPVGGARDSRLTQTTDLMPTILGLFDQPLPSEVRGVDLRGPDAQPRDAVVFGCFNGPIGITDGTYVLYHYPSDIYAEGLRHYTLAFSHMKDPFSTQELQSAKLVDGFDFTKGIPVLSIAATPRGAHVPSSGTEKFGHTETLLFNIAQDPHQMEPLQNPAVSGRLRAEAVRIFRDHDAPEELFHWYELLPGGEA